MNYPQKKILFLLHIPPPIHGSSMVGGWIRNSAKINSTFQAHFINLLASNTVDESGKVTLRKLFDMLNLIFEVLKYLRKSKPDLCYLALTANSAAFYRDVLLVFLLKIHRVKIIFHLHNKGFGHNKGKLYTHLCRYIFRESKVILLSNRLYDDIHRYVDLKNVYVCPNGIPDIESSNNVRLKNEQTEILFLSNLIVSKGVFVLLEACEILYKRKLDFKCTFVGGEGDLSRKDFEFRIDSLKLSEIVNYAGKKFNDEKLRFLRNADIFVFPSYYRNETFGLVNLEAMQFGLPVISTFEGGIPDIVQNEVTGFLVPQQDAVALADKLELLIKNPDLRSQMGAEGRRRYEKFFTLEKFESRMVEILESSLRNFS